MPTLLSDLTIKLRVPTTLLNYDTLLKQLTKFRKTFVNICLLTVKDIALKDEELA